MTRLAVRLDKPPRYRLPPSDHMTFPRELRDAIPPTCGGRVLQLDSVTAGASRSILGERVNLRLLVKETGKLKGRYTVAVDLQADAARHLAAMLLELAGRAEKG